MTNFATALAHAKRGAFAAAEAVLLPLVQREPHNASALHLLANVQHAKGDAAGALQHFARAAALAPGDAGLAFNHGAALTAAGRHGEAAEAFLRAITLKPGDAEAHFARGVALAALRDFDGALACYDTARAAGLDRAELHAQRGAALAELKRPEQAVEACDRALAKNPNDAVSRFNRGAALIALHRYEAGLSALDAVLALRPEHVGARAVRATALASLGRFDAALADIDFALARQPDSIEHVLRLGFVHTLANRRDESLAAYERVLARAPDHAEARFGAADALLSAGDFERGLALFEARLQLDKQVCPPSPAPRWRGENLSGKTLLVQGEQGFGDLFQFCRFIPELKDAGAHIVLQERAQARALMRGLSGLDAFVANTAPAPAADFHIPLCSLMQVLGVRRESIPSTLPYLRADAAAVAAWRDRLGPARRRRIGLAWAGNTRNALERARVLSDAALETLLGAEADFVSLQLDAGAQAPLLLRSGVRDFGADIKPFAELAALIETLDLVISIDTGVAHLAGALGKPVWILLPFRADWRWLREGATTPWYPQARLFRQAAHGDWSGVAAAVRAALQ